MGEFEVAISGGVWVAAGVREGMTLEHLYELARALSDVQAAEELNEARAELFRRVPARA